ncbi:hypothetical protein [Mycolicibacterium phlei]
MPAHHGVGQLRDVGLGLDDRVPGRQIRQPVDAALVTDPVSQIAGPPFGAQPLSERQPPRVADHQDAAHTGGSRRVERRIADGVRTVAQPAARRGGKRPPEEGFGGPGGHHERGGLLGRVVIR